MTTRKQQRRVLVKRVRKARKLRVSRRDAKYRAQTSWWEAFDECADAMRALRDYDRANGGAP